ncbi:hypothetical protein Fmac_006175 [Flemingia macrophylla]|uniref:Uncharacterized protein n=1 Tax=Flemingia macrophylla TaxID=520843 RepID=A0ABD1N9Z4_9FABA
MCFCLKFQFIGNASTNIKWFIKVFGELFVASFVDGMWLIWLKFQPYPVTTVKIRSFRCWSA